MVLNRFIFLVSAIVWFVNAYSQDNRPRYSQLRPIEVTSLSSTGVTNGKLSVADGSGKVIWSLLSELPSGAGILPVSNGGTGRTSLTINNLILGNGTSSVNLLAPSSSTTTQVLTSVNSTTPTWTSGVVIDASGDVSITDAGITTLNKIQGKTLSASSPTDGQILQYKGTSSSWIATSIPSVDLTSMVSGVLPVTSGGTGSSSQNWVDLTTVQSVGGAKTWGALATFSLGLSSSGAAINLNASSNYDTNINTGSSTGLVTIGNSSSIFNIKSAAVRINGSSSGYVGIAVPSSVSSYTLTMPSVTGSNGQVLQTNGSGTLSWTSTGTVTSVGLSLPSIFTVTNSPVTSSGTLTGTLANQYSNYVFAAPNGSYGTPGFRALVASDLPLIPLTTGVSGVLPVTNGGTGSSSQNWVDLSNTQTVAGLKTWSNLATFSAGLNSTGAAVNLNASSNYATNINTGTSTGSVTIGGTATQTIDVGAGAASKTITIGNITGSTAVNLKSGTGAVSVTGDLRLNGATSGYVALSAPATTTTYELVMPSAAPTASGQVLTANASGIASWGGSPYHTVGESYLGGIVFYVYDNGLHGLVAAPANANGNTATRWLSNSVPTYTFTGAYGDGVGAGAMNTAIIVASQGRGDGDTYAARLCMEYTTIVDGTVMGGWYLPSRRELYLLYVNRNITGLSGTFPTDQYYWSSTEEDGSWDSTSRWARDMNFTSSGGALNNVSYKVYPRYVRPIHAF